MAASLIIFGGLALAAYTVNENLMKSVPNNNKVVDSDLEFNFTRRPGIGAMFYNIGQLNNEPGLPSHPGDRLPFVCKQEANGVFGITKLLYQTPTNTLVTVYKGTEHKLYV